MTRNKKDQKKPLKTPPPPPVVTQYDACGDKIEVSVHDEWVVAGNAEWDLEGLTKYINTLKAAKKSLEDNMAKAQKEETEWELKDNFGDVIRIYASTAFEALAYVDFNDITDSKQIQMELNEQRLIDFISTLQKALKVISK